MTDTAKILRAVQAAAVWHASQKRKGAMAKPYLSHLLRVAELVAEVTDGADMICAALLHDAIEDQKIDPGIITELFGVDVTKLVLEVTDDKSKPQAFNKAAQITHAAALSAPAKLLKLADKTANLEDLAADPPVGWPANRVIAYVAWAQQVIEAMGRKQLIPGLLAKFDAAASAVMEKKS